MTAATIYELCDYLPPDNQPNNYRQLFGDIPNFQLDGTKARFMQEYKNLRFGWEAAQSIARSHKKFPAIISGKDIWVFRAYLFCCDNKKHPDEHVDAAVALTSPQMRHKRMILDALLVVDGADIYQIAQIVSLSHHTVAAYEKLFFNIIDRKRDATFLAEVVYPQTRMVELVAGYVANESLDKILMRAGYNNGAADVLYIAGCSNNLLAGLADGDSASKMETLMMTVGYIFARNGLLHQRDAVAVSNARNLISAAKQGGQQSGPESPLASIGDSLLREMQAFKKPEAERRAANYLDIQAERIPELQRN